MNSFSRVMIFLEVAIDKSRGKAFGDSGLKHCVETLRLPGEMLNKITLRNLLRSAGAALPIWSTYNNGYLILWLCACVQAYNQENTDTALQTGVRAQKSKFNRLKKKKKKKKHEKK